ncbi:hypothetical protein JCM10213_003673 [Rhodosporidiobolus nylandii]
MHTAKTLKRQLRTIKAQEAFVATWLLRIGLALALAGWLWEERGGGATGATGKRAAQKAADKGGKQALVWVGAAMGVLRLAVRWYFMRQRRGLEEELLEVEPQAPPPRKKGKRAK